MQSHTMYYAHADTPTHTPTPHAQHMQVSCLLYKLECVYYAVVVTTSEFLLCLQLIDISSYLQ